MHSLKKNTTVTEPIFIKIKITIQNCVNNYNAEFHENPTNGGVTDNRPQKERQTNVASTYNIPFIL
jgi:hypothetical protein